MECLSNMQIVMILVILGIIGFFIFLQQFSYSDSLYYMWKEKRRIKKRKEMRGFLRIGDYFNADRYYDVDSWPLQQHVDSHSLRAYHNPKTLFAMIEELQKQVKALEKNKGKRSTKKS